MFTVELRVNGTLINHIYGRKVTDNFTVPKGDNRDRYMFELYAPESREVQKGTVLHDRDSGIRELVRAILEEAE